MRMRMKKGFALIELLVIIIVLVLLFSIAPLTLGKARKHAKSAVCMANLNTWGYIWQTYTSENDNRFCDTILYFFVFFARFLRRHFRKSFNINI